MPSPSQTGRPGGYGGFGDRSSYDADPTDGNGERKSQTQAGPSLLSRMNTIAPGPFEVNRKPRGKNAFAPQKNDRAEAPDYGGDDMARNGDRGSGDWPPRKSSVSLGSGNGMTAPRVPRANGYGGFGPPQRDDEFEPAPFSPNQRSETFPKQSQNTIDDMHVRSPSMPDSRQDGRYQEREPVNDSVDRRSRTSDRSSRRQRPSYGLRDTSRPPPPRTSLLTPNERPDVPPINLADEFGIGNPYHSPTISQSSSNSGYQSSTFSSLSQTSVASSVSSPGRSRRNPSDTSNFDTLMNDLQSSMDSYRPMADEPRAPPPPEKNAPFGQRRARPDDLRLDPAVQGGRAPAQRSPPQASPTVSSRRARSPAPTSPTVSSRRARSRAPTSPTVSSRRARSPAPDSPTVGRWAARVDPAVQGGRDFVPPPEPRDSRDSRDSRNRQASHSRAPSMGRNRGNCKACGLAITGKSISSADGRLTGRYHKACFVCTTCQAPFTSAEFYVLDDKPYDGPCYHRLNGSCCTTCGVGIEGQYLEDDSASKHHPRCFRCGDCGKVLQDGYYEVNGRAFCERDAWKRTQPRPSPMQNGRNGSRGPPSGRYGPPGGPGGPMGGGSRLAPPNMRPRMEKRMTRLGMM